MLLLTVYVASQLAVVPHAHGANGAAATSDHRATPHVHLGWLDGSDHAHEQGQAHHHADHKTPTKPASESCTKSGEHDRDAFYLPDITQVPPTAAQRAVSTDSLVLHSSVANAVDLLSTTVHQNPTVATILGKCSSGCALYLALRTLRL